MALMVTSPVLLASSWEQVKTLQWGFERSFVLGSLEWNGKVNDTSILQIFLNQKDQENACVFGRICDGAWNGLHVKEE